MSRLDILPKDIIIKLLEEVNNVKNKTDEELDLIIETAKKEKQERSLLKIKKSLSEDFPEYYEIINQISLVSIDSGGVFNLYYKKVTLTFFATYSEVYYRIMQNGNIIFTSMFGRWYNDYNTKKKYLDIQIFAEKMVIHHIYDKYLSMIGILFL